jgi:hypothetical protein
MAHKTLVGGTAYEISGGKTLVNGTAYSVSGGKTLVNGTAYEVGFGGAMYTIKLSHTISRNGDTYTTTRWNAEVAKIIINGQIYDGSLETELLLEEGTIIECYVNSSNTSGMIEINNQAVAQVTTADVPVTYNYVVRTNATIGIYDASPAIFFTMGWIIINEE